MKKSIFSHLSSRNGKMVLYNSFTDALAMLDPQVAELYNDHGPDKIKKLHPDFYEFLKEKKFIVARTENESAKCIESWQSADEKGTDFNITINPTLNCNMRCWYCYEGHDKETRMSKDTRNRLRFLISNVTNRNELQHLNLTFFGGEPLLGYKAVMLPLIQYAKDCCDEKGKTLSMTIVTNGYLLSEPIITELASTEIPISLQITLDGNRTVHNRVKYVGSEGGFDRTFSNMTRCLEYPNFKLAIRLNYTHKNILSFTDLIPEFKQIAEDHPGRVTIDLQRVWQDNYSSPVLDDNLKKIQEEFRKAGLIVSDQTCRTKYRCYADSLNHVVINYDGLIFKCTARDFTPVNSEGVLSDNGMVELNVKGKKRESVKWGTQACRHCKAYPLCHGSCSQQLMEYSPEDGCPLSRTETDIDAIIEKRLDYLLRPTQ